MNTGTLSVVATPIGNLGDITLRALEVLKSADVISCEDTRVTSKLLARYEIEKPLIIFNAQSGDAGVKKILSLLEEGKHVALVTDAGTPGVSDPGGVLVAQVYAQIPEVKVETIPGASALSAALAIAGVPVDEFLFLGFLPHKKGRKTLFEEIRDSERTTIFYESPHRVEKALASLEEVLPENRTVVVFRELTKMYESRVAGSPKEVVEHFRANPEQVRGEFVVLVDGC